MSGGLNSAHLTASAVNVWETERLNISYISKHSLQDHPNKKTFEINSIKIHSLM